MRTINQIQSEIAKLEAEMADVKEVDSAQKEAVHILKNLGWTREKGQWVKPKAKPYSAQSGSDVFSTLRAGDKVKRMGYLGEWYVLSPNQAIIAEITPHHFHSGGIISNKTVTVNLSDLKFIE